MLTALEFIAAAMLLPFAMILHCAKNTQKAITKAANPNPMYHMFHESTVWLRRSASAVKRCISETFPGVLVWGFWIVIATQVVAAIEAWRTIRFLQTYR
jgi:hypothetical protein